MPHRPPTRFDDNAVAIAAIRFETYETNARRQEWDRVNYTIGVWNSHIRTEEGPRHLTWSEETPVPRMQREVMQRDERIETSAREFVQ